MKRQTAPLCIEKFGQKKQRLIIEEPPPKPPNRLQRFLAHDELKKALTFYESKTNTKYNVLKQTSNFSTKYTLDEIIDASKKIPSVFWESRGGSKDAFPILFDGTPYLFLGSLTYQCHQGSDKNKMHKEKYKIKKEENIRNNLEKSYRTKNLAQPTKKLGCPVTFHVKKLYKFTEFQIHENKPNERDKVSKEIKALLENIKINKEKNCFDCKDKLPGRLEYIVRFPEGGHMYHNVGETAGLAELLDERVTNHLMSLMRSGCENIPDLRRGVREFVCREILFNANDPLTMSRRFNPSRKELKKIMARVKQEVRLSKIDQDNVNMLKDEWRKWAYVHFVPRVNLSKQFKPEVCESEFLNEDWNEKDDNILMDEFIDHSTEGKLLFIYQNGSMRHLYRKYGWHAILLDAAQKTTSYPLPLYFLVVKTNVDYQPVAVIVTQDETKEMIKIGLEKIKEWNPDIAPKFALLDNDDTEIFAVQEVFPDISIFLSDYHREHAWTEWMSKLENGVSNIAEDIKTHMRQIAFSLTREEAEEAIDDLCKLKRFSGKFKKWFQCVWLSNVTRWISCYRPDDLKIINTNYDSERLNEDLNYDELVHYNELSLSEILTVIIDKFIPKHYEQYVEKNIQCSNNLKKYEDEVPHCIQNRPSWFLDLMIEQKIHVTPEMINSVCRKGTSFLVTSEASASSLTGEYEVDFGSENFNCKCSCSFFLRNGIPCKHFFAVIAKGFFKFEDVSPLLLNHPYINVDQDLFSSVTDDVSVFVDSTSETNEIEYSGHCEEVEVEGYFEPPLDILPSQSSFFSEKKSNLLSKIKTLNEMCQNIRENEEDVVEKLSSCVTHLIQVASSSMPDNTESIEGCEDFPQKTSLDYFRPLVNARKKIKHSTASRVGSVTDMMRQYYRAQSSIALSENNKSVKCEIIPVLQSPKSEPPFIQEIEVYTIKNAECIITEDIEEVRPLTSDIELSEDMKNQVINGERLSVNVINLSQHILKNQFSANGLENADSNWMHFSQHSKDFVQIVFLPEVEHYVVVTRDKNVEDGAVNVFDPSSSSETLSSHMLRIISRLSFCSLPTLRVQNMPVQQISNSIDSGVLALAFAVDILSGLQPQNSNYSEHRLRQHLIFCLELGQFSPFMKENRRVKKCKDQVLYVDVFCTCRQNFSDEDPELDPSLFMAQCSACKEWFHRKCVTIDKSVFLKTSEHAHWKCPSCT